MKIIQCAGYELEKAKSNTSEDFFNRSEITFVEDGVEKTLHVLYLRYFDQIFQEFVPFKEDPVFGEGDKSVYFKEIVALVCLLKNPGLRNQKRIYLNSKQDFVAYFRDIDYTKLPEIFNALKEQRPYELRSPLQFIVQPN
ncbi:MAG: hypothetical protein Q8934_04270 [Bacillota bacterium]|nr:hypothetical protein [Bacillota bacterium]